MRDRSGYLKRSNDQDNIGMLPFDSRDIVPMVGSVE